MSTTESPFLETLQSAHANGLAVRICERIEGGRFTYQHSYPAALISRFVTAPRRGTVVVTGNCTRVRISNIVSVTVEMPTAPYKPLAPAQSSIGGYEMVCTTALRGGR